MWIPDELQRRIEAWETLSRWEKSELGRDLRRLGLSYGEIGQLIDVKKSTLATWCRDIELTGAQAQAIKKRTGSRAGIPVNTQWRRRLEIERIQEQARRDAEHLIHDPLWLAGVVLYWAEGAKNRNRLELANIDPAALSTFIAWIRRYLDPDAEFALSMHLHEGNVEDEAKRYWSTTLDLATATFHKTFIKPKGTGHRKNHHAYGVCRVRMYRSANAWNRLMAWVEYVAATLPAEISSE